MRACHRSILWGLLLGLLLSGLLHAALAPSRVAQAEYTILDSRDIDVLAESSDPDQAPSVRNLTLQFGVPSRAVSASPADWHIRQDPYGNLYLEAFEASPSMPYALLVQSNVSVSSEPLRSLPASFEPPADASLYLRLTPDLSPDDPRLDALAQKIGADARTPFERLAQLAVWTHDYIQYDARMADRLPVARAVLDRPRGVCTEYTLLFTALSRRMGYPTRFVGGYAYSDAQGGWQGHSWAEVWLGRWVPVDPTWLEVGSVDATHIVLSRTPQASTDSLSVAALIQGRGELQLGEGSLASRAEQVHALHLVPRTDEPALELSASTDTLPPGGQAVLWADYNSSEYGLLELTLSSCALNKTALIPISSASGHLISEPNRTYRYIWSVQVPADLDSNYLYQCPLALQSGAGGVVSHTISISDDEVSRWPMLSAALARTQLSVGEPQSVFIHVPSELDNQTFHLLESDMHLQVPTHANGTLQVDFVPSRSGEHILYLFTSRGDPLSLTYTVSGSAAPVLALVDPDPPALAGHPFNLTLQLANRSLAASPPSTLAWSLGDQSGQLSLADLPDPVNLTLPLSGARAGDSFLVVRLLASDGNEIARQAWPIRVWAPSDLSVGSLRLQSYASDGWRVLLQLDRSGDARDPQLVLRNSSWSIPEDGLLRLILPAGYYPATLRWKDASGSSHEKPTTLNISAPAVPVYSPAATSLDSGSFYYDTRVLPVLFALAMVFAALMILALFVRMDSFNFSDLEDAFLHTRSKSQAQEKDAPATPFPPSDFDFSKKPRPPIPSDFPKHSAPRAPPSSAREPPSDLRGEL